MQAYCCTVYIYSELPSLFFFRSIQPESIENHMVWKSIVMFHYSLKGVKRLFNRSHVFKRRAQSFARGYKNVFSREKFYIDFLILVRENILH